MNSSDGTGRFSVCFNALFLQNHLGGIGNYAYHLIRNIRALRPEWSLTLLIPKYAAGHFRSLEGVQLLEVDQPSRTGRLIYFHMIFPFLVRRFDLLHSVGNMGMLICPIRQIITIHDLYEQVSPERFSSAKRFLMKFLISWSGRGAAAILTDSLSTKRDIGSYYPHLLEKTRVVYLGNKFPVEAMGYNRPRKNFIFVGTIEPGKNLIHILQGFAAFRKRHPERLKVVGATGWGQSSIPAQLDSLGIRDCVDFLGYVPDSELKDIYAGSLALIVASNYEGFGLPVIEAMACGCPVICARNSSLVEAGGDCALFFETGDISGMTSRMEEIYRDADLRQKRIEAGFAHAGAFKWEKTASESADVYESVIHSGK